MDSQTIVIKPAKKQLKIKTKKIVVEPEEGTPFKTRPQAELPEEGTPFKTRPQAELPEVVEEPTDFIAELMKEKEEEDSEENPLEEDHMISRRGFESDNLVESSETESDDEDIDRQIELLKQKKMEKNKWKVDEINEEITFQEEKMNEQITRIRNEFLAFKQRKESEIEKLTGKKVSPIVTKPYWRKKTTTAVGEDGEPNWKKKYTPEQYARKVAYDKAWRERKAAGVPTKLGRGN